MRARSPRIARMLTVFMVTVFPVRSIGKVYALFPMLRRADQIHVFDHAVGAIFVTAVLLTNAHTCL